MNIDPSTIDLEMALKMTSGEFTEPLSYKSDRLPHVIDFDELDKIESPKGYTFKQYSRDIRIKVTTFRGICYGAVHYYCSISFSGPTLCYKDGSSGFGAGWPRIGSIFGCNRMDVNRPVTADDLADKLADWTGYHVGYMTHRWYDKQNAIECAKRIVELRFKNYGKVEVIDYAD